MDLRRYHERKQDIIRSSDRLAGKTPWDTGDYIQAQCLLTACKELNVDYAVYKRLELRLSFRLQAGTVMSSQKSYR